MRVVVLINEAAGTVRERGAEALGRDIEAAFAAAGHDADVAAVAPDAMDERIRTAAGRPDVDAVIAGGGDGTLSAAAAGLAGGSAALGCLPLGTMNLYCRALGMPMDPIEAARSLSRGRIAVADMGAVNGRPFLHHVSVGLQPSIIATREKEPYSGRLGKMWATAKTFLRKMRNPMRLAVVLHLPEGRRRVAVPAIVATSNPIRSDTPGIRQSLSAHRLGLYVCASVRWSDLIELGTTVMLSDLADADCLELFEPPRVAIERRHQSRRGFEASVDGEILHFRSPLEIRCRQGALRLLVPDEPPP